MATQPDISAILAALANRPGGTPSQSATGVASSSTPTNSLGGLPLPQPTNSGSLDLSAIKPGVNLADAIAKARNLTADKGSPRDDPRRAYGSRSRSRSPTRRDNYRDNYNPYRDERRDDPRRGASGRERSYSPSRQARYSPSNATRDYGRSPKPIEDAGGSNSEIITVESSSVGLIIGRNGENLKRVETETGARVQFVTGHDPNAPLRQCKITGTTRQRAEAKRDIYKTAEENPNKAPSNGSSHQGSGAERNTQIMVPDRTVGLIIGRGGETIRDLQERSGCHINITGENKSINGLRPVNLIGNRESANRAKELIMEVVDSDTRVGPAPTPTPPQYAARQAYDPYAGYGQYESGAKVTDMLVVPSEAVGMIIGKGGETIKEIQNSTGCKVNVSPPSGSDITREIGLIGTRTSIESAKRAIWEKVGTVREKQGGRLTGDIPPYGDPYAQHQPPPYAQPPGPPMPPSHHMPPPPPADQSDPYAAYGGYQNYVAMWYAAVANQPGHPPPHGP